MSLKNAIDNLKYDCRMYDINLKNSNLTEEDLKKHLDKLPDLKAQSVGLDLEAEDVDDIDDVNDDMMNGHSGTHQ